MKTDTPVELKLIKSISSELALHTTCLLLLFRNRLQLERSFPSIRAHLVNLVAIFELVILILSAQTTTSRSNLFQSDIACFCHPVQAFVVKLCLFKRFTVAC